MRTDDWYQKKLADYFYKHYAEHEYDSKWFVNPAPNKFKCYLPKLQEIIVFTCDENSMVTEQHNPLTLKPEKLHEIILGSTRGMDAVYEDYVIKLIGREGFDILRNHKILESCGSVNGRRLYTVKEI